METYSEYIDFMLKQLKTVTNGDQDSATQTLIDDLKKLRLYSDIAEIVAHPKNNNIQLTTPFAKAKERDQYLKFREDLKKVIHEFLTMMGEHNNNHHISLNELHELCDLSTLDHIKTYHQSQKVDTFFSQIRGPKLLTPTQLITDAKALQKLKQ